MPIRKYVAYVVLAAGAVGLLACSKEEYKPVYISGRVRNETYGKGDHFNPAPRKFEVVFENGQKTFVSKRGHVDSIDSLVDDGDKVRIRLNKDQDPDGKEFVIEKEQIVKVNDTSYE